MKALGHRYIGGDIIRYNFSFDDYEINVFSNSYMNKNKVEIFVKVKGELSYCNRLYLFVSGIVDFNYSDSCIERVNNYKMYQFERLSQISNYYYIEMDWYKLDAKFYVEFSNNQHFVKKTEPIEINYLEYTAVKKVWNESIYFIMIDRYISDDEYAKWGNDDYFAGGSFESIYNDVSRISDMGFSIVYLSPIMESKTYHGYNQYSLQKINNIFGGEEKLKLLVDKLENSNIKLGIEYVANHLSVFSNLFKCCLLGKNDIFYINNKAEYEKYRDCPDLAKIKYSDEGINYVFSCFKKVIEKFHIKFIRLDCCDYLNSSFVNMISLYCNKKDIILTGECWNGYNNFFEHYNIDGATNYYLYRLIREFFIDNSIKVQVFQECLEKALFDFGYQRNECMLTFIDNHDIERISSIVNDTEKIKTVLSFIYMYIGIPVVYYGTENFNETVKQINTNRRCMLWDEMNYEIVDHLKYLNGLRKKFVSSKIFFNSKDSIFAFSRESFGGNQISFIYNSLDCTVTYNNKTIADKSYVII